MRTQALAHLRRWRLPLSLASGAWAASFLLYVRTLAPSVLPADSGEFQFGAYVLGLVHPTGYPLFLLLGRLFAFLPVGDVAFRLNLMSAFWGAATCGLVYLLGLEIWGPVLRRATVSSPIALHLGSLVAAALLAVSDTFWSQASIAEVYSLNAFFVALVLWIGLLWSRGRVSLWPLALVFGLSLTHHRTMILLIPGLAVFLLLVAWRRRARSVVKAPLPASSALTPEQGAAGTTNHRPSGPAPVLPRRRGLVLLLALLVLPLLLYLYIPLRAPATSYLRVHVGEQKPLVLYQNDLRGFWDMISGRVFAGKLSVGADTRLEARWELFWTLWSRQFGLAGVVLGGIGALWLVVRHQLAAWLLLLSFGVTVGFGLTYTIGDVYVMFIPAYLVWAVLAGGALSAAGALLRLVPFGMVWQVLPALAGLLFAVSVGWTGYAAHDLSGRWEYRRGWEQVLAQPLEEGALLATNDRDDIVPLWYFQQVEGRRRDLVGIFPGMVEAEEFSDVVRVVDYFSGAGRPAYLIKTMPGLEIRFRLEPAGLLTRLAGPAASAPPQSALAVDFADRLLLSGYDVATVPGGKMKVSLRWKVLSPMAEDYTTFIHLADATGKVVAQSDHRPGGDFYPSSRWRVGEILADGHEIALPALAAPGPYELRVGIYYLPTLRRLPIVGGGDIFSIGQIDPAG